MSDDQNSDGHGDGAVSKWLVKPKTGLLAQTRKMTRVVKFLSEPGILDDFSDSDKARLLESVERMDEVISDVRDRRRETDLLIEGRVADES